MGRRLSASRAYVVLVLALHVAAACRRAESSSPPPPGEPTGLFFDLEFDLDLEGNATEAYVRTISGERAILTYTPAPSHAFTHSGSPVLENKANFGAYPLIPLAMLEEISGDGDGVCEPLESCHDTEAQAVANRIPLRTHVRMRVAEVSLNAIEDVTPPSSLHVGSPYHWGVRFEVGDYTIQWGHIGWIAGALRQRILDAGGPDPDTYSGPTQTNILPEGVEIILEPGELFAYPQAARLCFQQLSPGACVGFHQIEFFMYRRAEPAFPGDAWHREVSPYLFLTDSERHDLVSAMHHHMRTETGIYRNRASDRWLYSAEAALETVDPDVYEDALTLLGRFGEWYDNQEIHGRCTAPAPSCDDALVFWPMVRDTPVFDPALYHRPGITTLAAASERRAGSDSAFYLGEVIDPLEPAPTAGSVTVKWRMNGIATLAAPLYQAYRYALVGAELRVVRGTRVITEAEANAQRASLADPATSPCDGVNVLCMTRAFIGGLPGGN